MLNLETYLKSHFPQIKSPALIEELKEVAQLMDFKDGDVLMDIGSYIKIMPLVIVGGIKVMRESDIDEGGELFLYYLYPGQSCAMTLNCCRINSPSEIRAVAEGDTKIIAVPVTRINSWMDKYSDWKEFTLQIYSSRFTELLQTLDSVAFHQMDERLIGYLKQKVDLTNSKVIQVTHQQVAYDLNTSREVISRLLKKLEKGGNITLSRNKIQILGLPG